jgi:esterase/lipase superfamily enzyme
VKSAIFLSVSALLLCACIGKSDNHSSVTSDQVHTTVFYGTDRNRIETDDPENFYGQSRGNFEYGVIHLSVSQPSDSTRIDSVEPQTRDQFLNQLNQALAAAKSPTLFVFVHGYNRSFNQVTKLTAEFAEHIDFPGVPVVWNWPSSRKASGYVEDQTNMQWSIPHFSKFLRTVIEDSGATTTHILAHSMGAWGLTNVMLEELLPGGLEPDAIGEFVLLAPDIDQELFRRDLAPELLASGLNITLYTSSNDKAMASSWALHGYPRAGDSSSGPLIIPGIETIDATETNASILGHSYFEESEVVRNDLKLLLNGRASAAQRPKLNSAEFQGMIYWQLPEDN